MHVANLELCKKLYELSGWGHDYRYKVNGDITHLRWIDTNNHDGTFVLEHNHTRPSQPITYPAYDLGYLLRKLPHREPDNERFILTLSPDWLICYEQRTIEGYVDFGEIHFSNEADTPEDAACKLAIELFKQGVLTKGHR